MTKYYAGIGARDTPSHIQTIMSHLGSMLAAKGLVLRSGGAKGADTAFEKGCDKVQGSKEIYLPWCNYNNNISTFCGSNYPFTDSEKEFTERFHPAWRKLSESDKRYHYRNTRIIIGMESLHGPGVQASKFVICWTSTGRPNGGTGQPMRIAQALNIPIFNLGSAKNPQELEELILQINQISSNL